MGAAVAVAVAHVPQPTGSGPVSAVVTRQISTTPRARSARLVSAALVGTSQAAVGDRAGVSKQRVGQWADEDHDASPNLTHLLTEGGSWAAAVLRLASVEVAPARQAVATPMAAAEVALQILEATEALLRYVSASTRGRLTPELTADAAKATAAIHRLAADLHPGLLTLAREGR